MVGGARLKSLRRRGSEKCAAEDSTYFHIVLPAARGHQHAAATTRNHQKRGAANMTEAAAVLDCGQVFFFF